MRLRTKGGLNETVAVKGKLDMVGFTDNGLLYYFQAMLFFNRVISDIAR